jgi:hypothetical protein
MEMSEPSVPPQQKPFAGPSTAEVPSRMGSSRGGGSSRHHRCRVWPSSETCLLTRSAPSRRDGCAADCESLHRRCLNPDDIDHERGTPSARATAVPSTSGWRIQSAVTSCCTAATVRILASCLENTAGGPAMRREKQARKAHDSDGARRNWRGLHGCLNWRATAISMICGIYRRGEDLLD